MADLKRFDETHPIQSMGDELPAKAIKRRGKENKYHLVILTAQHVWHNSLEEGCALTLLFIPSDHRTFGFRIFT